MVHTRGLSIKTSNLPAFRTFLSLDTEGQDGCVPQEILREKRATEAFLKELVLELSTMVIIVVNRLKRSDQIYIESVVRGLSDPRSESGTSKSIYILHNFSLVEKEDDIEVLIKREIEGVCKGEAQEMPLDTNGAGGTTMMKYWTSVFSSESIQKPVNLLHFVMAKEGSRAGYKYNDLTISLIRKMIHTNISARREVDFLQEIKEYSERLLPCYLKLPQLMELQDVGGFLKLKTEGDSPKKSRPEKAQLLDLTFDDTGRVNLRRSGQLPNYNMIETADYYDVHLDLAGCVMTQCMWTPTVLYVTAERVIDQDFQPQGVGLNINSLRREIDFGLVEFKVPFSERVDENKGMKSKNVGNLYYFRFFKVGVNLAPKIEKNF